MQESVFRDEPGRPADPEWLLDRILGELAARRRVDLRAYRREVLKERLAQHLSGPDRIEPEEYLQLLKTDPDECDRLIEALMVRVSRFFRNPIVWEILESWVVPEIIRAKKESGGQEIRIWSAGCASGEEAYSAAITVHRALRFEEREFRVHIFGTDISSSALAGAVRGRYRREDLNRTRLGIIDRYFIRAGSEYLIRPEIREMVCFSREDLTSGPGQAPRESIFGSFDLVLCRNVLIYFNPALQRRVARGILDSLAPRGWLVLGDSENPDEEAARRLDRAQWRANIHRLRGPKPWPVNQRT